MIIDTHSHLNFKAYETDREEVIRRAQKQGVVCIDVGTKYETSKQAVKLAEKYENIYAAIGMHPIYAGAEFVKIKTDPDEGNFLIKEQKFDKEEYKKLAKSSKVVAIGEIGLDYYYKPKTKIKLEQFKQAQKKVFIEQLELAKELNLPVILHCRMAHADLIEILKSQIPFNSAELQGAKRLVINPNDQSNPKLQTSKLRGVIHCFTGNWEDAQQYINLGFYVGINGIIFSALGGPASSGKLPLDSIIKQCPLDRILVETDCPYLTPPQEGNKRNEPIFIKHIIQKIADIKAISFEEISEKTTENAKILFNI